MSDLTHPLVLTYASPALSGRRTPNWLEWARLALLFPALVVPFVSFTWGTSPLSAVEELPSVAKSEWIFILLGGGFFVGFPLFAWRLRNLLPGVPRRWERLVGWFIAFFSVLIPTAMLLDLTLSTGPADLDRIELGMLSGAMVILGLGIWHSVRARTDPRTALNALLSSAYLANAWVCLIGFHDKPETGYWLTVPVASLLLLELAGRSLRWPNALRRISPSRGLI